MRWATSVRTSRLIPVLLLLTLALAQGAAAATRAPAPDWLASAIDILQQHDAPVLSINDAASRARNTFGGQVISITPAEQDGRRGYRVKVLLDSGRVKTLFVEARSGSVIDRRDRND